VGAPPAGQGQSMVVGMIIGGVSTTTIKISKGGVERAAVVCERMTRQHGSHRPRRRRRTMTRKRQSG
jgi:hypothetical protein